MMLFIRVRIQVFSLNLTRHILWRLWCVSFIPFFSTHIVILYMTTLRRLLSWSTSIQNVIFRLSIFVWRVKFWVLVRWASWTAQLISFRRETICDALTQTGWKKFLSKFFSSRQMERLESFKLTFESWSPTPSQKWEFGILAHLEMGLLEFFQQIWTQHQKLALESGLWDFSRFGLGIKS